jgi:hypothetical protein
MPGVYQQTEKEVFGDDINIWKKYKMYKLTMKHIKKHIAPPSVWVCAQTLMLIDKGLLNDIERQEAVEALNELGWSLDESVGMLKYMVLRPMISDLD